MISFDNILEKRIGTGFYQGKALAIIGLVEFCDGLKFTFMSILIAILKKEWDLSPTQVASLGSVFLLGAVVGNLLCAFMADNIGRKLAISIFTALAVIAIYTASFCNNYQEMILLRLLIGISFGTTSPLGYIYISEITVSQYRGRFALGLSLIYVLGKISLVVSCFFYLQDFTQGNWRGLLQFNGIPMLIAFLLSILFIHETARYFLNKKQFQKAFQEIEFIVAQNNKPDPSLLEDEKQGLQAWSEKQHQEQLEQELHRYGVLSSEYLNQTIILWILYILTNLQNMTMHLLMPFLFAHHNSGFTAMLNLFLLEFVSTLLNYYFIDDPKYGGRVKIIAYSAIALILSNGWLFLYKERFLFAGLLTIKIATRALFSTLSLVSCESYPLAIRSQGCGIAQAIGKIGAIPSPYFLFPLFFIEPYLPFSLMLLLSVLILILTFVLEKDKTQKYLETLKDE